MLRNHSVRGEFVKAMPWWSRFSILQLAIATVVLVALFGSLWTSVEGDPALLAVRCSYAYLVVVAAWPTRRVAAALALMLEERRSGAVDGFAAVGRTIEAVLLPLYCAAVLLGGAVVIMDVLEAQPGMSTRAWMGTLSYVGEGVLGMMASAITLLCIYRRRREAGWIAVTVAQAVGAAIVVAVFRLGFSALRPPDGHDTWYAWVD